MGAKGEVAGRNVGVSCQNRLSAVGAVFEGLQGTSEVKATLVEVWLLTVSLIKVICGGCWEF